MTATQELIAAALTAADDIEGMELPQGYLDLAAEATELAADLREACARAMVQPDMAERDALIADNERLMQIAAQESDVGARVLREVFALCEDTQDKCSEDANDFTRGRRFEAKGIARAIGTWYQDEFCGRSHMGEPAAPAPDHFHDAAKMAPVHCTPTEHDGRIVYEHTSEPIPNADGFVLYAAPAPDRFRAAAKMMAVQPACMTCSGHGMVGGLLPNGGGYQADPCPDCAAPVTAEVPIPMPEPIGWLCWTGTRIGDGPPAFCTYEPTAHSIREQVVLLSDVRTYGDAREAAGYAAGVAAVGWRDVADEPPKEAQEVLFVRGGKTIHGAWIGGIFWHNNQKMVAAKWMPLPAPQTEAALRGEVK